MDNKRLSEICITADSSIRQAIACINADSHSQIALVVDDGRRLLDTITDGDVRRAILAGVDLNSPVSVLRDRRAGSRYMEPVTATAGTEPSALLQLMQQREVHQVPLLDGGDRVTGLATLRELLAVQVLPVRAVVMAGGYGNRLRPLTEDIPKPMLPVGDRPLLELIVNQLREAGVRKISLTTHYKSERISKHFGDGRDFGVEIRYLQEETPLGTAGALNLLERSDDTVLVINGDILTRVDFRAMLDFHQEHRGDMTVAVGTHEFRVPYGVIESDGVAVTGIAEKPLVRHFINAGIYLLASDVLGYIPSSERYDMTDLIARVLSEERTVLGFPMHEYWLDIGQIEDYRQALADMKTIGDT